MLVVGLSGPRCSASAAVNFCFSFTTLSRPLCSHCRAMRERYQPVETARRGQQTLSELFGLVTSMPRDLARLVKDARHGRMRVDLDLKRLDRFGDRLHSAMDRATIGIMTASLVVGRTCS
jgi:hypothetical protein